MQGTDRPYWWEAAEPEVTDGEPLPAKTDVVIVGGGYAGMGAAIPLARAGRRVAVLERDRPGDGASSRNGGITSGNLRRSFSWLTKAFGVQAARSLYMEQIAARADLYAFIENEEVACDFHLTGRFAGALSPKLIEDQKRESDVMYREIGIESLVVERADQHTEIGSDRYFGGIRRPDIGGVHPAKLCKEMRRLAQQSGAKIWGGTGVTGIVRNGTEFEVKTTKGEVRADHVIVATNGYTDKGLPWLRRRLVPVVSEMIATEPLDPELMKRLMPKKRMHSEIRRLGHYYRPSPDGTRILFGGRRYDNDSAASRERLRQNMVKIFPELRDVGLTHHWFGFVAFPMDQLPKLAIHDGIHYASGFSGSGVVWARWMGQKAAYRILEREDGASAFEAYSIKAIPLYAGTPWFLPIMMRWYSLQDRCAGVNQ